MQENGPRDAAEEEVSELPGTEGFETLLLILRYRGGCARTREGLPGHKGGPSLHTTREWRGRASVLQPQGTGFCLPPDEAKSEFLLEPPHRSPTS